jgi:hypothetical protein
VLLLFGLGIAISAINRLVATRLKGNLGLGTALAASYWEHLARASAGSAIPFCFPGLTASGTALGIVDQTFRSIKLLLFNREGKRFAAICTNDRLFRETHKMTSI